MKQSEDRIQTIFMNWIRKRARTDPRYGHAYHIPNGGRMSKRRGQCLKLMGVVAGIPDVFIGIPNSQYHGLYIEFKTPTGKVSPVQKAIHKVIRGNGYQVEVCRSVEQAQKVVEDYEEG